MSVWGGRERNSNQMNEIVLRNALMNERKIKMFQSVRIKQHGQKF